jgi:hypothetical protein
MRHRSRFQPFRSDDGLNHHLLNRFAYCKRHHCKYPMNVMNQGRIEAGKCPECYPPKPPATPARSTT